MSTNEILDTNNDSDAEQLQAELDAQAKQQQAQADAERDALAAETAQALAEDEQEFDPTAAMEGMTAEQQQAAIQEGKEFLGSEMGATLAAEQGIELLEDTLREHGHEKFAFSDVKKEVGVKRLSPVIRKYAPQFVGMLGEYKDEILAAVFMGTTTYGAIKQIKALKAADALAATPDVDQPTPETAQAA